MAVLQIAHRVLMICRTLVGAAWVRLVISGWVADLPNSPSRETTTSRPGKIDNTA